MALITFEYNGKQITTPNLEKKLKRMKISLEDIKIISNKKEKKTVDEGVEDYMKDKEQVIIRSTQDDIRRLCYVTKGTRPPIKELLKKQIWDPETRTGVYPELFIETMYYDE